MNSEILNIFAEGTLFQLSGLLGLTLFFVTAGFREIGDEQGEGYLYLTVALFLFMAHAVMLSDWLDSGLLPMLGDRFNLWVWLVCLVAPALVFLLTARGLVDLAAFNRSDGLHKLFFAATLLCYVFMVGRHWPIDIRGIITIIWIGFLFKTELAIAD